jgi:hypothetical protein
MKNPRPTFAAYFVAAVSLLFISAVYARAQQPDRGRQPRVLAPRLETMETMQERMRRENSPRFNDPSGGPANPFEAYRRRALESRLARAAQVRKDRERIQFFNGEMMRAASPGAVPDYDRIIKATGEIKKRAARLMLNLNLPKLDKSEKPQAAEELLDNRSLALSLKKLDEMVQQFGADPLPGLGRVAVLDVKAVTNARLNLAGIVVLSDQIRKSAKRLRQQTGH